MGEPRIDVLRRIVAGHQYEEMEGVIMDAFTASMLVTVHDALAPENQARFDAIPLPRLVDFGWQHVTTGVTR